MTVNDDHGQHYGWNNYSCSRVNEVGSKWAGVDHGCLFGSRSQAGLTRHLLGRISSALQIRWNLAIPKGVSQVGDPRVMEGYGAVAQTCVA